MNSTKGTRIFLILLLACFCTTFVGWQQYYLLLGETRDFTAILYVTVQTFLLNTSFEQSPIPLLLDISRFIAPLLLTTSVLSIIFSTFRDTIDRLIIRFTYKNHYIICGVSKKSLFIFRSIMEKNSREKVVFIEINPDDLDVNELKSECKNYPHVKVIYGDALEVDVLQKANIQHASYILTFTDNDETNSLIAEQAIQLIPETEKLVRVIIHLNNYLHLQLFKDYQKSSKKNVVLQPFNINQKVAGKIIEEYCPDKYVSIKESSPTVHIAIFGFGEMGEYLFTEALHLYHFANLQKLSITLVVENVFEIKEKIYSRYPDIDSIVDLKISSCKEFENERSNFSLCLIADHTVFDALVRAKRLRQLFTKDAITTELTEKSEINDLSPLLETPKIVIVLSYLSDDIPFSNNIVSEMSSLKIDIVYTKYECNKELIIDNQDACDAIAKQMYALWGEIVGGLDSTWEKLSDSEKDMNRYPARHLAIKLRKLGACIAMDNVESNQKFTINKEKPGLARLAQVEHNRWNAEKILTGYVSGKDIQNKNNQDFLKESLKYHKDLLFEWGDLSPTNKAKDSALLLEIEKVLFEANKTLVPYKMDK